MRKSLSVLLVAAMLIGTLCVSVSAVPANVPSIVKTVYPTDDVVVAEAILTEAPYNADNSGAEDCTAVLQRAIDDLSRAGGGTVFLPVGSYRLTGGIDIKPFVTVRGDWADPDKYGKPGTLIIADVPSVDDVNPALFTVGGSSGAVGLAVYYPRQSLGNVLPYPYTFYVNGSGSSYMLQSIVNCTLINSYRGIGACAEFENGVYQCHEMLTVENVKGTCLSVGISTYNSADVDTYESVYFGGKYWASAGAGFNAPSLEALNAYTRQNATGMRIADLEWPEFADIHLDSFRYGLSFVEGPRISFAGTFYDLFVTDCDYGIYAPKGTIQGRGKQWGIAVARGVVEGSKIAIYDPGDDRGLYNALEISGKVVGENIHVDNDVLEDYDLDYDESYVKPSPNLAVVTADKTGRADASAAVQSALDSLTGGGVCYLPAGVYRFDAPVSVPAGVELRGATSVATRDQSGLSAGTLILSYFGYDDASLPALITLKGKNAGMNGIRVLYPYNNPTLTADSGNYRVTSPAVRGAADGVYVVNSCFMLASVCVEMNGCDDFFIKKVVGCSMESMFSVKNCSGGTITGSLQNGNSIPRNAFAATGIPELQNWLTEDKLFAYYFIPISREGCEFIRLAGSEDILIWNTFIYGGRCYLKASASSATVINTASDGSSKNAYQIDAANGGEVNVINFMHSSFDGKASYRSYSVDGSTALRICNRLTVDIMYHEYTEELNTSNNLFFSFTELRQLMIQLYTRIGILITMLDQN